ncbi:hypothetical protein QBC37DRAFT_435477 [Rhypophila decipiens]|uniref:C2H2-type domain-containing protein n=1 Tax=Rhypophila decipiens TaxID=261697 RepID=A0AAN6XYN8_9PEZI|nr:hypothetical protein QBC37DRAFT_435477 [Rhypophila decipiens]
MDPRQLQWAPIETGTVFPSSPQCPTVPVLPSYTPISWHSQSTSASPVNTSDSDGPQPTPRMTVKVDLSPSPPTDAESQAAITPSVPVALNCDNNRQARKKSFPCLISGCPYAFGTKKDLERHCNSVHGSAGDNGFRCRCGKVRTRKDNHDRHILACRNESITSFRCWCGHETGLVTEHREHIRHWTIRSGCPGPRAARQSSPFSLENDSAVVRDTWNPSGITGIKN